MQLAKRRELWDPIRELESMNARLSRLFGLAPWTGNGEREALTLADFTPACDISENEKEYKIRAEIPGLHKDDVKVTLEKGVLTIQGERKEEKEEKGTKFHRKELTFGSFLRSFTMPEEADESKVNAIFKNGILEVVIGKMKKSEPKSKEVPVH